MESFKINKGKTTLRVGAPYMIDQFLVMIAKSYYDLYYLRMYPVHSLNAVKKFFKTVGIDQNQYADKGGIFPFFLRDLKCRIF